MNQLVQKQDAVITTPTNLLELAVSKGADVDQLEKLMALQANYEAKQAKTAYLIAVTKFQSEVPRITKSKSGHNFSYAPLADIVEQIKSTLQSCGLSYRFEQNHQNGIEVTCVLSHIEGHSERTSMKADADTSGSKNSVQAIGSTVSYCQRYTLIGSLGLTTADEDMDGRLPFDGLSVNQISELDTLLDDCEGEFKGFKSSFFKWAKVEGLNQVSSKNFDSVKKQIVNSLSARRKA
jgi:uncharacterized protein YhaN